jgi:hypothetical protein
LPRPVDRPHPWRSAWLIFAGFVALAIVTGLILRFAVPEHEFIDNLPEVDAGPR